MPPGRPLPEDWNMDNVTMLSRLSKATMTLLMLGMAKGEHVGAMPISNESLHLCAYSPA